MSNLTWTPAQRHQVRLMIETAHHDIDLEERCRMLAGLNNEYGRGLTMLEDDLEAARRKLRRRDGCRHALIFAALWAALATAEVILVLTK